MYVKCWAKLTPFVQNADFQSIFARSVSAVTPSEKCLVITNRKPTTRFSVSLRWTARVVLNPLPLNRGSQNGHLPSKSAFHLKIICYKVSSCKYCQWQSCKSFIGAYLYVHQWLVGDVPLYVKIWPKLTYPLQNTVSNQYSLFAHSAWAVTPSEKTINMNRN